MLEERPTTTHQFTVGDRRYTIVEYREVTSTMDVARHYLPSLTYREGLLVRAEVQTHGRGRLGREWKSPASGFWATFAQVTTRAARFLSGYSLVVGIAVAKTVEELGGELLLKWPNDLLSVDKKKVGGILIEVIPRTTDSVVLTGIGVNLREIPSMISEAASLKDVIGMTLSPAEFGRKLLPYLEDTVSRFELEGFRPFRDEWRARAAWLGEEHLVTVSDQKLRAHLVDIDDEGRLLIEHEGGSQALHSGEILYE